MLLENARDPLRPDPVDRRKVRQPGHASKLAPIGVTGLLYTLTLYVFYRHGFIGGGAVSSVAAVSSGAAMLFYCAFRTGFNTRFAEPSLMLPQLLSVLAVMLTVTYFERTAQIALAPFVLIAFSFAVLRLSTATLMVLALTSLSAYLGIVVMHGYASNYDYSFRADLLQWFVLALTLPGVVLIGKQIQNLRQLLTITSHQLEHFEEKSVRDELTGLYNRRQIQAELEHAKLQADTCSTPFSICLIDIDHFKDINDTHGHLAGDTILKEFANVAVDSIRDTDVLGRYGGDEFIQILRDTDVKGAVMHAERLRVYAHFLDFQKILTHKHISLSIGVAQYRRGEKLTDLISRADSALYHAKQLGRNRVEWAEAA